MDYKKDLLLKSAARLYSLGMDLEAARERLRQLVACGFALNSVEVAQAYQEFAELEQQWKTLEQQHIDLRYEIYRDNHM